MSRTSRGFSIAEMLIAAFTFLLVFGVGLWAVSRGMNMHSEAAVKQSLQREIQAIRCADTCPINRKTLRQVTTWFQGTFLLTGSRSLSCPKHSGALMFWSATLW